MSDAGVRVHRVDFIATLVKVVIVLILSLVIFIANIITTTFIIKFGNDDIYVILGVFTVAIIWLFIYFVLLTNTRPFIICQLELDVAGNVAFKHNNIIFRFNMLQEFKKGNLKVDNRGDSILMILNKSYNKYKVEIYLTDTLYDKALKVCLKYNIVTIPLSEG